MVRHGRGTHWKDSVHISTGAVCMTGAFRGVCMELADRKVIPCPHLQPYADKQLCTLSELQISRDFKAVWDVGEVERDTHGGPFIMCIPDRDVCKGQLCLE